MDLTQLTIPPSHGMKAKTIKAVIRKKIDKWVATIDDETLRKQIEKNVIVTGGAIASMLLGETVNDFDVYFRDHATTLAVASYYVNKFKEKITAQPGGDKCPLYVEDKDGRVKVISKSKGFESDKGRDQEYKYFESQPDERTSEFITSSIEDPGEIQDTHDDLEITLQKQPEEALYRPVFLSSNAITLSDKVQIVLRFYGEPDTIHENYDFAHCTNYWKSWDNELVLRPAALEALLSRELKYVGSKYPICSLIRLRKFIARGWRINAGQVLKMVMQVGELDLTSVAVLEDQLTGVDTAYFVEIIKRVSEKDPERVNSAYLVELIDRMF